MLGVACNSTQGRASRTGEEFVESDAQRPDVNLFGARCNGVGVDESLAHHLHGRQGHHLRCCSTLITTTPDST